MLIKILKRMAGAKFNYSVGDIVRIIDADFVKSLVDQSAAVIIEEAKKIEKIETKIEQASIQPPETAIVKRGRKRVG